MSELHDKDGMLKKSVPDKGAAGKVVMGLKGPAGIGRSIGRSSVAVAASGLKSNTIRLDSVSRHINIEPGISGDSGSITTSHDDNSKSNLSADTIMFAFTDEQREYLLARHNASKLSDMAYDSEVGGTIVSRAMAARKDVEGLRDALNLAHKDDDAKSGVKFSDVIDAKDDAAKSIFMNSGLGDEDVYYDKMREDYMKSISEQFDKESVKSGDGVSRNNEVEADKNNTKTINMDDPDLPQDLDDPDVPQDYDGSMDY